MSRLSLLLITGPQDDLTSELDDWIVITNNYGLDVKILVFNDAIPEEKKDLG